MDLPIVVGVDGCEPSLVAVDRAADEAALRGASLRLVHASLWERYEGGLLAPGPDQPSERRLIDDLVAAAERRAHLRQPGVKVTTDVLPEEPDRALVRESRSALAMVLGRRGGSGMAEALRGSVSLTVAGHAHCPVIVVPAGPGDQAGSGARGRIVLGVGEKPDGSPVTRFAIEEASLRAVPLEAVRAWRRPLHALTGHLRRAGGPAPAGRQRADALLDEALRDAPAELRALRRTVEGHARDVLLAVSHEDDLLVIGARRHQDRHGPGLGRVVRGVLHHATCPVAVVPEPP
jgi:nucleotide-binding universal stress UspA family protein